MANITLRIDGNRVTVPEGTSLIEACEQQNIKIPRFCYHKKLQVAGNCRMCLVEVEGDRKPIASCAATCYEGMVVQTQSPKVKADREGVLEFLLANHPLDCPVCDQGGECDLQDITLAYGKTQSRYQEQRRLVTDPDLGPLIKTIMTRCIHCTRCIRFTEDVAGEHELGAIGRGESMEITGYLEHLVKNELSGNVIDLCPVGALTAKPSALQMRSWELKHTHSIDVMDAVGSHIRLDSLHNTVMRVVPNPCEEINEEWLSDKARFAYDGLRYQRLEHPYIRSNGKLQPVSWAKALEKIRDKIERTSAERIGAISGNLSDMESTYALKLLFDHLHSPHTDCRLHGEWCDPTIAASYTLNKKLKEVEECDVILLVGCNPRWEAPLLNHRIRKSGAKVYYVSEALELNYPAKHLGETLSDIDLKIFTKAKRPMVMLGDAAVCHPKAEALFKALAPYNVGVVHHQVGMLSGVTSNFLPGKVGFTTSQMIHATHEKKLDVVYLLGADDVAPQLSQEAFIIYQGHHGAAGAQHADVVLPGCAYTEKATSYMNIEGRIQQTIKSVDAPGDAREDTEIICNVAESLGITLPFTNALELRQVWTLPDMAAKLDVKNVALPQDKTTLKTSLANYYNSNIITAHSPTMKKCIEQLGGQS